MNRVGKNRILVVEDDFDIQDSLKELLEHSGYEIQCANNGFEALKVLQSLAPLPTVILLDLMMPIMDGISFREEQRKDPKLKDIPVVVMSADLTKQKLMDKDFARALLKKPIEIEHLLNVVSDCCLG